MEERKRKGGLQSFKPTRQGNVKADRDRWENGGGSGMEQQRNKGRKELEADFEFFEDRTASYLHYHTDICQTELKQ